ncbi:hypothetical protein [Vibrio crassostreae]|uniref:hypothetical protein n=1 Tax=Vibrio crassostreae TaxID=246167 RepID=UPI001B3118CF|nr:hypothetical protein [Vibrio crassostreae]
MNTQRHETAVKLFKDYIASEAVIELKAGNKAETFNVSLKYIVNKTAELMTVTSGGTVFSALKAILALNKPFYSEQTAMTDSIIKALLKKTPVVKNERCIEAVENMIGHYRDGAELTVCADSGSSCKSEGRSILVGNLEALKDTHWLTSDIPYGLMFINQINKAEAFGWKQCDNSKWRNASKFESAAYEAERLARQFAKHFDVFTIQAEYLCANESLRKAYLEDENNTPFSLGEVLLVL